MWPGWDHAEQHQDQDDDQNCTECHLASPSDKRLQRWLFTTGRKLATDDCPHGNVPVDNATIADFPGPFCTPAHKEPASCRARSKTLPLSNVVAAARQAAGGGKGGFAFGPLGTGWQCTSPHRHHRSCASTCSLHSAPSKHAVHHGAACPMGGSAIRGIKHRGWK